MTSLLVRTVRTNPPLAVTGLVTVVVLLACLAGLVADPRQVLGEPTWLKPAKFAVSISLYSLTLVWFLTYVRGRRRLVAAVSWIVAAALLVEQALIMVQAARGLRSHFNVSTALDQTIYFAMAGAVATLWATNVVLAVVLLAQRLDDPVLAWGLRAGLVVAVTGMAVAFLMTDPTPAQLDAVRAGGDRVLVGAHSVSRADGGPGLPVLGWSTVGGDLRVAHFVGIHAMQALPLVAWLLAALPAAWLTVRDRTRLVQVAGATGLAVVLLLTWQALRGQPLTGPDALTAGTAAVVALAALAAAAGVVLVARRRAAVSEAAHLD
ncbi:hypothetical protein [Promicromonospora sukumoe]|uniref:hypothetical protein n=1 Tax=Promicromonospora sukumoe TaxID=88382 RepID=UPI0003631590|nr:hypothetical protein [Promicromonospora sukumoe]